MKDLGQFATVVTDVSDVRVSLARLPEMPCNLYTHTHPFFLPHLAYGLELDEEPGGEVRRQLPYTSNVQMFAMNSPVQCCHSRAWFAKLQAPAVIREDCSTIYLT